MRQYTSHTDSKSVYVCIVALDDSLYRTGPGKHVDFSCNSQFGAYCAEAFNEAIASHRRQGTVLFLDVGCNGWDSATLLQVLAELCPTILLLVPCGRYSQPTYALIDKAITLSRCLLSILAGPCLPGEPFDTLEAIPLLDGVMLGDDFSLLWEIVAASNSNPPRFFSSIPGFAWRLPDGSLTAEQSPHLPVIPGGISPPFRSSSLPAMLNAGRKSDNFRKWLIDSSSGCPRECIFCRTPIINRRQGYSCWRPRPAQDIADEIEEVTQAFSIREFRFQDDNFLFNSPEAWARCHDLAAEITRREMLVHFQIMAHPTVIADADDSQRTRAFMALERAGLERIFLGIESGHDPTLAYFRKETTVEQNELALAWLTQRRLLVICGCIAFHPHTTLDQLRAEYSFFRKWLLKPRVVALAPLASYAHIIPGSQLADEVFRYGLETQDESGFVPVDPVAAAALRNVLILRPYLFAFDWFIYTVKRDLQHWARSQQKTPDVVEELTPAIIRASLAGIDASYEVIDATAKGVFSPNLIRRCAEELYRLAEKLSNGISGTPFAPHWRASLYDPPTFETNL